MRVIAGFDEPEAGARFLLTEGDTVDKVTPAELKLGALIAAQLAASALGWPGPIAGHRAPDKRPECFRGRRALRAFT